MTESQIRAMFTQIAGGEPAPSGVDTQLAHRRGRARLRWRRAALAGSPVLAAAVAVAVALAAGVIPGQPGPGPAARPAAPQRFDPLAPYASFGWLPPGESMVSGGTGEALMSLTAAPAPDSVATWDLQVYAAGQCDRTAGQLTCSPVTGQRPGSPTQPQLRITGRAPSVHGHRAFWSTTGLAWQYARGGWALLTLPYPWYFPKLPKTIMAGTVTPGTTRATVERDAVKIAGSIAYGAATPPLLFPAQLTGLPRQWHVSGATYAPDGSVLRARTFALNAGPGAGVRDYDGGLTFQDNLPWFGIDPVTAQHNRCYLAPGGNFGTSVREVIDGYHVIVTHEPRIHRAVGNFVENVLPRQDLCADNAGGLSVYLSEYSAHPALGVTSLFKDHLRLLGASPANWTAKPIR
jgi:hypothetical protein